MPDRKLSEGFESFFNLRSRFENPDAVLAGRAMNKLVQTLNTEMDGILHFEIDKDSISGAKLQLDCKKMDTGTSVKINIDCDLDAMPPEGYPKTGIHTKIRAAKGNHIELTGPINDTEANIRSIAGSLITLATCQLAEAEKGYTKFDVFKDVALAESVPVVS